MKVSDLMTPDVQLCTPEDAVRDAAEAMAELDVGLLPVAISRFAPSAKGAGPIPRSGM